MLDTMNNDTVISIETLLQHDQRLQRDKGFSLLNQLPIESANQILEDVYKRCYEKLISFDENTKWESVHGCLSGLKCILLKYADKGSSPISEDMVESIREMSLKLLRHFEVRVRTAAGELQGALCKFAGSNIFDKSILNILQLLHSDLQRRNQKDTQTRERTSSESESKDIFHQSAGWRYLETSMKCLQHMIENCDGHEYLSQELLDVMFSTLSHENRFVRETGFNVLTCVVKNGVISSDTEKKANYQEQISQNLAKGLADNWSQVRLASSRATRSFLLTLCDVDSREIYFPVLLPRLCLNRYYIADGVRIYTQETWRIISQGQGKKLVEKYIDFVVKYYAEATAADNHAVREAACACISELGTKIEPAAVTKHVPALLDALLQCFQDDSWPVRDAACIGCGNFLLGHPESAESKREILYQLFLNNLKDPIPSVREGAGIALGKYTKVYGNKVLDVLTSEIKNGFVEITRQQPGTGKFSSLDKKPAKFGVVENMIKDVAHTDQVMYSCGSLAPKMGRGRKGGCMDCHFQRPSEPWERADGTVFFLAQFCKHYPNESLALIDDLAQALAYKDFDQHLIFLETVCNQLPVIAQNLGKKLFKTKLALFVTPIFYALHSDVQLTAVAAERCLNELSRFIGAGILKGRIEMENPSYVYEYEKVLESTKNFNQARPFDDMNSIVRKPF